MAAFVLLLLFLLPLPLSALLYHLYYHLRFRLPPGPFPWPVVGNLYQIKPVRFRSFADLAQTYGPIISVWLGTSLNVVVSNAELAKEVLKDSDALLADRHRSRSATTLSRDGQDLIWADYGPHYVKVRKFCTMVLFSPKRLESLRPIREEEVTAMVESIYDDCSGESAVVTLKKYLSQMSFHNTTRVAFGKRMVDASGEVDAQGVEFKAISANGHKLGASLALTEHVPWLRWADPLDQDAFTRHGARMERLARDLMEEHTLLQQVNGGAKDHFFDALLTRRDEYGLTEDNVIALLWDMMAAGMDTPAIAVEWAMAELVRNPRVQQKAQEELDRVVGPGRVMTELDIPNLPYLRCVVKEALRLHPPTPLMLPHRASAHVQVGGYDIPKGTILHVSAWALGRDPDVWKDPLEFRPERFVEEDIDPRGYDFRFLPFGSGRRVCPGAQLGLDLTTSLIGHLLHQFSWSVPAGVKVDLGEKPGTVTFLRTPVEARAEPRLAPHLYKRVAVDI